MPELGFKARCLYVLIPVKGAALRLDSRTLDRLQGIGEIWGPTGPPETQSICLGWAQTGHFTEEGSTILRNEVMSLRSWRRKGKDPGLSDWPDVIDMSHVDARV